VETSVVFFPRNRGIFRGSRGSAESRRAARGRSGLRSEGQSRGELQLNFLGDLTVVRGGAAVELPPSRKTRALLAYLALNQRPFRREHLCELLWEIPDDPRGSLRWSLSKLRRLVDGARRRVIADRVNVRLDTTDVAVDVAALKELAESGLEHASAEVLESAAERYRGNFLEGLELSNHHDFHAWCIAERELAARAQSRVLRALIDRLADAPERALPHARSLVGIHPYDEAARAKLIRLLVVLGRADEAEQQYRLGSRLLKEAGAEPSGTLYRAWRGAPGSAPGGRAERKLPAVPLPESADRLIGRDREVERLSGAFARVAQARRAELVRICGEPGIGKSRLLGAAKDLAGDADAFILEASAFESETIRPFALWIDALRRAAPTALSDIFDSGDRDNRERLFGALSDLVARESASRPVVLILDDLQWCDESSAAALHYVARMNRDAPLLGVLASREAELRDNGAVQQALRGLRRDDLLQELKLAPLAEADARRLIESRAPGVDSKRLSEECAGNPLLAIELARAEAAGDSGNSLDELVRERLERFDVDGAEVLRWAAVLAPRIDVAALERATGLDAYRIGDALESAERQAMLVSTDPGFRFSHDLVGRSIYKDISPSRRRMMHRRAAELLEQDTALDLGHAADLAHHAVQSGDPGLAVRAMVSAGRLCLRFFANRDALTLARKGLRLVERLSDAERVCLTLELREIMLTAAPLRDWEAAAAEYGALAERALDHGALTHARLGYYMASYVRWMHGRWAEAREEILEAARVTRSGEDEDHIIGMAEAAKCMAMLERDLTHADAMLMEARALAARKRVRHHAIPMALGMLRYHENRLDEAEELFKEGRTLCKSAGDRVTEFQANEYLLMIDFERGRFEAAMARCGALVEIGERLREGSEAPFAHALEALCRYAIDDETASLDAALDELRAADAKHRLAYTLTRAALLDVERGRVEDALARAGEALGYAQALERATEVLLAHVALARAHRAAKDTAAFERHLDAIAAFDAAPVAQWARTKAAPLTAAG
jgi:DNA-binding SARP family transcriptional activator/tetratricopeptide (TPR) repeat protein